VRRHLPCVERSHISSASRSPPAVAVVAGTVLPYLAERDRRLLAPDADDDDDEDEDGMETEQEREFRRIKAMVEGWKLEAKLDPKGKPVRLPTMPFMLRNIWTAALVLFSVLMYVSFVADDRRCAKLTAFS
jgi:solute carrier family 45 protein 1/2/4